MLHRRPVVAFHYLVSSQDKSFHKLFLSQSSAHVVCTSMEEQLTVAIAMRKTASFEAGGISLSAFMIFCTRASGNNDVPNTRSPVPAASAFLTLARLEGLAGW